MIRLVKLGPGKDSTSDNLSVYKHGQADGSSVKTNYLVRSSSVQTNLLSYFVSTDDPSVCINAIQDKLLLYLFILVFSRVFEII